MEIKKQCKICGKEFISKTNNGVICSEECRKQWRKGYMLKYRADNKEKIRKQKKEYRKNMTPWQWEHERALRRKYYNNLTDEKLMHKREVDNRNLQKKRQDPEYRKMERAKARKYYAENREHIADRTRLSNGIRLNPPYTTDRGIKISFFVKDGLFYYKAESKFCIIVSDEGFYTVREAKLDVKKNYGKPIKEQK